jgi:hypothetical protein
MGAIRDTNWTRETDKGTDPGKEVAIGPINLGCSERERDYIHRVPVLCGWLEQRHDRFQRHGRQRMPILTRTTQREDSIDRGDRGF